VAPPSHVIPTQLGACTASCKFFCGKNVLLGPPLSVSAHMADLRPQNDLLRAFSGLFRPLWRLLRLFWTILDHLEAFQVISESFGKSRKIDPRRTSDPGLGGQIPPRSAQNRGSNPPYVRARLRGASSVTKKFTQPCSGARCRRNSHSIDPSGVPTPWCSAAS
jgi:hypothetical protein